jgi:gliding motility-associated-like protein
LTQEFQVAGNFNIYYNVTDGNGCSNIDSITIQVDTIPNAAIQAAGPFCANEAAQTVSPVLNFGYFTNTPYIDSSGNFDPRISGAGNFSIYYNVTDGNGCSNIDSITIQVDTIPNAAIQATGPFCANEAAQTVSPVLNFGYFTNTPYIDSSGNFDPRISGAGNFSIYYNVTDGNGCSNIDSITIQVDTIPNAAIQAAGPFCANEAAQTLSPVLNFGYFTNTPYIDSSGNFDPRISGAGNFSIYYNVTDGNGCSNIDSATIQVDTIPNATIQAAGPYCANEEVQTISPVLNLGYFTNTAYIDSSGNFDPRISGSGNFRIYYNLTDGNGCTNTDSTTIQVDTIPNATILAAGPYCANDEVQTVSPVLNFGYFTNTAYIDSAGNFDPRISGSGNFRIYYNLTDANGCSNIDSTTIQVDTIPNAAIQAAGPYCGNEEVQTVSPVLNFGYFTNTAYIDSSGNFDPRISGAGNFRIYYNLTDGNGCSNTDSTTIQVDTIPSAAIQAAGPYCANDEVQTVSPVLNFGYFTNTAYIDSSGNFDPRISGAGNFRIYYNLTDGNGCSNMDSTTIEVDTIPNAAIQAAGPFCANEAVQTVSPVLNFGYFTNTPYIDSSGNFDPRISGSGNFSIYYNVSDGNGCSNIDSITIQVDTIPNAAIQATGPFCANEAVQTVSPVLNFGYFTNTPYIDSSGNFDPRISGTGNFSIYYNVTDGNGCSNMDSITIQVDTIPNAAIQATGPFCANEAAQTVSPVLNFGYFTNTPYIDSSGNFDPRISGAGNFNIYYNVTDGNGCSNIDSTVIRIEDSPNSRILHSMPYCLYDEVQTLVPEQIGGYFHSSIAIDSSGNFNPSILGVGYFKIYYFIGYGNQCYSEDSIEIRIDSIPNATIQPVGPFCANEAVQTVSPVLNFGYFTNTAYIDSTGNFDPRISGAGNFNIYYNITDGNGCSNIDSITIQVDTIPNAAIQLAGPYCSNDAVQTISPVLNFGHFTNTSYIDSTGNFDPRLSGAGDFNIYYNVTDGNGCSNMDSIFIRIHPTPDATILPVNDLCLNDNPYQITTVTSGGAFVEESYVNNSGLFSPQLSGVGSFAVIYNITNQWNCSTSDTINVVVRPIPVNNLNIEPKRGCEPLDVILTTEPQNTIRWLIDNIEYSTDYETSVVFDAGVYTITLEATNDFNCSALSTDNIESVPKPIADFITNRDTALIGDARIIFTDKSTGNVIERSWFFGDGGFSSETNPIREYLDTGVFEVKLIVENMDGCTDTTYGLIVVEMSFSFFIPNAFTPGSDGLNDLFRPVGHSIEQVNCKIFNRWGEKLVDQIDFKGWDGTYMGEYVQNGVYLYLMSIKAKDGRWHYRNGEVHVIR